MQVASKCAFKPANTCTHRLGRRSRFVKNCAAKCIAACMQHVSHLCTWSCQTAKIPADSGGKKSGHEWQGCNEEHPVNGPGDQAALLVVSLAACHCVSLASSCLTICQNGCIAAVQNCADEIFSAGLQAVGSTRSGNNSMLQNIHSTGCQRDLAVPAYLEDFVLACILQHIIKVKLQHKAFSCSQQLLSQLHSVVFAPR